MDQDLIQVVNKLQETFSAIGGETVDLPQIVVVGSQSSGKSSVLETIVGRDFLPRGSGIVTRRPLVLSLLHISSQSDAATSQQEYGEFLHTDKRFYDFAEIRKEIENETLRVAGQNKGISRLPIHLKIHSPNVLNLTLVDLPGLTKIPVGDQPSDIERQIRNLVLDYITKPNCVILAVSPANVDLANSDSLKLARSIDPQGRRTIGVLTKLDLMDNGTNALDILTGRVYPLKLGFIGVVNRSQQDILDNLPISKSEEKEVEFFRNHPAYRNISHRCGTKFLAKTLNSVLLNHIREKLPDMKARLNTLMGQTQQELSSYGDIAYLGPAHRGTQILKLMTQFVKDFIASIEGTSPSISTKELSGGARIYHIFHEVFGTALESLDPNQNLSTMDIRTAIKNSKGPKPSLFVPEVAFDLLVKPQIELLGPPSLRCVELVYEELMKICHNCTSSELQRYPRLHAQLVETVSELLRERLGPTSEYVSSLIDIQKSYINTNHPEFTRMTAMGFSNPQNQRSQGLLGDKSETESTGRGSFHVQEMKDKKAVLTDSSAANSEIDDDDVSSASPPRPKPHRRPQHHSSGPIASSLPNGRASLDSKTRTGSSSLYDRPPSAPRLGGPDLLLNGASGMQNGAGVTKDSFLNYFFGGGGPGGVGGAATPPLGARGSASVVLSQLNAGMGGSMIGYGSQERADNPLLGRKGYEGTAAALEMKSLERHLEPTPVDGTVGRFTEREEMEINLIRNLILSYFSIVRQSIEDLVPKAVMHLLVNHTRESVQNRLVATLYKETLFDDLLQEDEGLASERSRLKQLLDTYKEAFKTLSDVF